MSSIALKFLSVPAVAKHTATVIFGLGDTGYGWEPVADDASSDSALQHIKWILPHAPMKPVTANMGITMPSWFDIKALGAGFGHGEDEKGMLETVGLLQGLIDAEVAAGIDPGRIILGGFSQGAAMTLLTGLTTPTKLGGLVVLSGWLPLKEKIKSMISPHATSLPIFWGHGDADPLVKFEWGTVSRDFLSTELGFALASSKADTKGLSFNGYRGLVHSSSPEEINDLKAWLKKVMPGNLSGSC
ncbi:Phospholipase/carboxylesterase [Pleurotus eryngii]|uniref:Acyl-protein thioesterase 1 n=1 Tax=Pleurotus eryngii TaxID=5323 RepID=A0A9P5ZX57_PLEER|nr:Phospholipase/carboxylesterase [Pleurotus eryngii]